MKKLSVLFLGMVLLAGCGETSSTRKPEKEDVLKSLRLANDYFMEKWSDPGEAIPYPSRKPTYGLVPIITRVLSICGKSTRNNVISTMHWNGGTSMIGNFAELKTGGRPVMPTINVPVRLISIFISSTPRNPSGISSTSKPLSIR